MIKISYQEVQNLAKTSRIALNQNELEQLIPEIEAVLEYASVLAEVACKDQKKSDRVYEGNIMREDTVVQFDAESILKQAPEREGNYFVVPAIIKKQ